MFRTPDPQLRARLQNDRAGPRLHQVPHPSPRGGALLPPLRHLFSGVALAYLGRKADAIREGELGDTPPPLSRDKGNGAYGRHQLIRIYLLTGETDKALDRLEDLMKVPYGPSPQWVRVDPTFAELKGNPRFEAILKASDWKER